MRSRSKGLLSVASLVTWLLVSAAGQETRDADWPLHNLDLKNSRFSLLDQINASNVATLTNGWSFHVARSEYISQETPLVIDGVMYFNSGTKLFAVDAATGKAVWTVDAQLPPSLTGKNAIAGSGGRGPTYGNGRIYASAGAVLYAVDAKTGKFVDSFGEKGVVPLITKALAFKYPGKYPDTLDLGYRLTGSPAYFANTLYVGTGRSANLIPGGLLIALDATTGAVKWVFTTIPQGPADEGWELTKDTWGYGRRSGGGIWTQPSIDPELGMIYFNAANPSPDYDGTARLGMNLFTNSIMALHLATGKLAWYFQTTHHDLWDSDLANGPVLFDVTAGGKVVKGVASFGKTCYAYILNRETGQPINPIVEMPVPTTTDVPGEKPWPTQPIPFTSFGTPQQPFCTVYPVVADPETARRVRPQFHPFLMNERVILSPGVTGGAIWGSSSFSPRTGFLYVAGKNQVASLRVKVVGDTINPGPDAPGYRESFHDPDHSALKVSHTVAAYDAFTGAQVWRTEFPGSTNAGNLVTGGDVLFQAGGNGNFFAFDARTGRQLFTSAAKIISGSPSTYQVRGKQYVSTIAGDTVVTFTLP